MGQWSQLRPFKGPPPREGGNLSIEKPGGGTVDR